MPQLRDSSIRQAHNGHGHDGDRTGFDRIFGVETEYGLSVTGVDHAVDAGRIAMTMFRPIVSSARSTNVYMTNGSRLYLDVGSHPEYATAEARDPMDALALDLAGERVMAKLAMRAQSRLRDDFGERAAIHVFKNNVDYAGHSFGCHENYLVRRFVPLPVIERQLLPFLITRQLYTGAGRITRDGLQITQRADFLDEAVSSATTRARPMINTRDEAHADPESYRRLHVIIGDSNRSQWATWMKLATTHLVLCVIEDACRRGVPCAFDGLALSDPTEANRAVSRWLMHQAHSEDAVDVQRRYFDAVAAFVADHRDVASSSLASTTIDEVMTEWEQALEALGRRDYDALATRVDWAAKRRLFDALSRRRSTVSPAQLEQIELDYHDIANGRLYDSLMRHGQMRELVRPVDIERAAEEPPSDTRAALRGAFVRRAGNAGVPFTCDWTTFALTGSTRGTATLLNPFDADGTERFRSLLASI